MRTMLLALILTLSTTNTMAEWVHVGGNDRFTLYSDPATINKSGNIVKMLRLTNFKTVQISNSQRYLSTQRQDEYDCVKEQHRIIFVNAYTENMGEGYVIMRVVNRSGSWKPILPGSQGEAVWNFACER